LPPSFFVSQGLSHHSSFTRERSFERKKSPRMHVRITLYSNHTCNPTHSLTHTPFLFLPCLPPLNTPQREKMRQTRRFHCGKCTHRGFHQARRRQCKSKIHAVKKKWRTKAGNETHFEAKYHPIKREREKRENRVAPSSLTIPPFFSLVRMVRKCCIEHATEMSLIKKKGKVLER